MQFLSITCKVQKTEVSEQKDSDREICTVAAELVSVGPLQKHPVSVLGMWAPSVGQWEAE